MVMAKEGRFRRLFGSGAQAPDPGLKMPIAEVTPAPRSVQHSQIVSPPPDARVVRLPAGSRQVRVVGVAQRQEAFNGFAPGAVVVRLRPEPTNPYDRHAVAVDLPNGAHVGYLYADLAADYQPHLKALESEGSVVVEGRIEPWDGGLGVHLNLLDPDHLVRWMAATPAQRERGVPRKMEIKLAGGSDCHSAVEAALGAAAESKRVKATVRVVQTGSGKYKGQPRLEFWCGEHLLGWLLPTRQVQMPDLFDRALAGEFDMSVRLERSQKTHRAIITADVLQA